MRNALERAMMMAEGGLMAHETDAMQCRACGREERASEGYPCAECGTFLCLICSFRGVTLCKACQEKKGTREGSTRDV